MKAIHYRVRAREDLRAIADYYGGIDPDVADRMLADIERAIAYLREYPEMGQAVRGGVPDHLANPPFGSPGEQRHAHRFGARDIRVALLEHRDRARHGQHGCSRAGPQDRRRG